MSEFQSALRRVITGDNARCESVVIIDGAHRLKRAIPIWAKCLRYGRTQSLTPKANEDRGAKRPVLGPRKGNFQVRWFVIHPQPDKATTPLPDAPIRERFAEFTAWVTSSMRRYTQECMRHIRLTSSVCCREKHLSYSKVAKLDCAPEMWSYSAGPTTPGRHIAAPRSSWPS
jgi:hypothetical protein